MPAVPDIPATRLADYYGAEPVRSRLLEYCGAQGGREPSALALIALGYKQVDSRKAVRAILEKDPAATAESLIRGALRSLQG